MEFWEVVVRQSAIRCLIFRIGTNHHSGLAADQGKSGSQCPYSCDITRPRSDYKYQNATA